MKDPRKLGISVGLIFLCFLGLDMALIQLFRSQWFSFVVVNAAAAQLTLLCIWGTLVEGTFWVRLPWTVLLLVISWAAIVVGVRLDYGRVLLPEEVLAPGLVWFFGFVVSFVPLKIAAWGFGWRISQRMSPGKEDDGRYAIRDMMIGTAFLAVVLAIGKAWVPGELPTLEAVLRQSLLYQPEFVIAFSIFSFLSLVVKLPCIWIALATGREKLIGRSISWILISGVIGVVEFFLFCAVLGPPGTNWLKPALAIAVGHMLMAVLMIGVLCVLRSFGYRIRRKRSLAKSQPT